MAVEDLMVTIRVRDLVTPALRRIKRQMWLLAHPGLALALMALGWFAAGFLLAVLALAILMGGLAWPR